MITPWNWEPRLCNQLFAWSVGRYTRSHQVFQDQSEIHCFFFSNFRHHQLFQQSFKS